MALDTAGGDLGVFFLVLLLQPLVTNNAIVVKGELQVELLLVLGQLLFAFNCGVIVTFLAPLDLISLFPGVLAVLVHVMALGTVDLVNLLVFLM